ncbi:prolyl oligopeptidase family serine peptidase [uncultured Rikenella sp.]|uniref:prolyl oligopeptidase family serine peptidase n=1 Tax=uncultured Rikenella sp. TaxID=368003 RepID=UPI0025E0229D|nr:prolyl oligopeptidase family serine peptidase [uncultured Rikenella sp.]
MNRYYLAGAALLVAALTAGCQSTMAIKTKPYPETRKDTTVVDDYHGTRVADPYRWLEDDRSTETAAWVAAQNAVTQDYLAQIPYREQIKQRLTELYDYPKEGTPFRVGEYYFFYKNDGLQNQSVLYYQKGLDGTPEVFLDPNTLSKDGTVALNTVTFSKDDRYAAYSVSRSGSDWVDIYVMEVATRKQLADKIEWVKFSGASWGDGGFYYSRYDAPAEGASAYSAKNEFQKVYFHKLGTPQAEDRLIYEDKTHPLRYFSGFVSDDFRWLFIVGSEGTSGNEILYKNLTVPNASFKTLFKGFANDYSIVDCIGNTAYVLTNAEAPNFRLVSVDLNAAVPVATDVIPESENLLEWATTAGGAIFAGYLKDASSRVYQYGFDGALVREIALPGIGTAGGFSGEAEDTEVFYGFSSFNVPPTSYRYTIADGTSTLYHETKVNFDVSAFTVEQVFYPSKDGTRVPMFLVYKKGLKRDGSNPVYLYAYGGFNISRTPGFSASNILLLEQGGIYALANIRGGGEYGEAWHRAGMLEKKQNVFDDFIAAAEYLIAEKYTSPQKLAIAGGSNGGLLIGACLTQRPDLYCATFPMVGVLDMLRYHRFTIGWGWVVEYGSADNAADFPYLYKYSPLHNIKRGTCYPPTMIMTADHDDRVVPAHSFKFGATLQAAQGCENPILLRVESDAGHGAGKPISKSIQEQADIWSFFLWNAGVRNF